MLYTHNEAKAILEETGLNAALSAEQIAGVRRLYGHEDRCYHDWDHCLSVLSWLNVALREGQYSDAALSPYTRIELMLAALFHDAVYDREGSPSNEQRSVAVMSEMLGSDFLQESKDRIQDLIMFTAAHGKIEMGDVELAPSLLLDADLYSFGEPRKEVYQWNTRNVLTELAQWHSVEVIAEGRKKFLRGLLSKRSIYCSGFFYARFEAQARKHIESDLQTLLKV